MMAGYFNRLVHRTGRLDTSSPARQTATAAHSDVVEIKQQAVAPVHVSQQPSRHNTGTVPVRAGPIQDDAIGVRHSVDHSNPQQAVAMPVSPGTATLPPVDGSLSNLSKNNSLAKQSIKATDSDPKQPHTEYTGTQQQRRNEKPVEQADNNNGVFNTVDQFSINPFSSIDPGHTHASRLTDSKPSLRSSSLLSETPEWGNLGVPTADLTTAGVTNDLVASISPEPADRKTSTTDSFSISGMSIAPPGHNDQAMLASDVQGLSYTSSLPVPDKAPSLASKQNVEVRIGSVTMEVHQKQAAVVMSPMQPQQTGEALSSSQGHSSGFRPSRYYLRGL